MSIEKNKLGMALFLMSESVFFLLLILAYIFYHSAAERTASLSKLDPARSGIFTIFLLASSATIWLSGASLKRGNRSRSRWWLAATILLGAIFLSGQGAEYFHLFQQNVTISRDVFGTTFFTLTGFHGLHVFGGLILLAILFALMWLNDPVERQSVVFETISLYWHFVDIVWIAIFSLIYLWALV